MPSEGRLNFLKNCLIYVSKGVIWASEYSLGPHIWGPGGARAPPPGSATGNHGRELQKRITCNDLL